MARGLASREAPGAPLMLADLSIDPVPLLGALAALAALALAVTWFVRRVLRPLERLRAGARDLADARVPDTAGLRAVAGPLGGVASDLARASERLAVMRAQLDDETRNLRTILESLTEGVLIVDVAGIVRSANGRLLRMFDLKSPPNDRSVLEIFRDVDLRQAVAAAIAGEPTMRQVKLETRGADGIYVPKHFDLTAVGILPPGAPKPVGAIVVFHDITEFKALESVRREFVANVSHELRTPLSIINGYIETLLEDEALSDRALAGRALEVMRKHGLRLNFLVEDLLTISRFEHGRGGLDLKDVPLRVALDRVVERLEPAIAGRSATIETDLPADLPPLRADPDRLDQILFNLLENALKYGPAEGLRVSLSARAAGAMLEIAVRDNGPGIPQSDQPHIFERFYRVHKDRSRDAGGTGLGLSIVKHLVQAHGGRVRVESALGAGAAFHLELPAAGVV